MKNKSLKTLFMSNGIFVFAGALLGPLYAIYVGKIDKAILSVSLSWFVFLISGVIATFIVSKYGDKIKEKEYLLMGGFLIRALTWFLFIYINTIPQLLLLQLLLGIGEALGNPSFDTIFAEHLDRGLHISNYSKWKIIEKIANAAATLIGGFIVIMFGFTPLFITMSFLAIVSFFIVLIQPRRLL